MKKYNTQIMFMIVIFSFLLVSLFPISINITSAQAQAKIVWKTQNTSGSGTLYADYYRMWVKRVNEMSGGRLVIEPRYAGEIVPVFDMFDAAKTGALDASYSWTGYWFAKFPAGIFFAGLPGGLRAKDFYTWLFYNGGLELWQQLYDRFDLKVLPIATFPNEVFCWSRKPLRTLQDFKGLKIRQSGIWVEGLKELGASPVTMAGDEVLPALERGVIDAAEFSALAMDFSMGYYQAAKYAHFPSVHQPGTYMELIVNKKSWDALPENIKSCLIASAKEACFDTWLKCDDDSVKILPKVKAAGVNLIKLSPEIQKKVLEVSHKILEKYAAKDPMFAKVYKSQLDYSKSVKEYNELFRIEGE